MIYVLKISEGLTITKFGLTCVIVGPPKSFWKDQNVAQKKLISFLLAQVDVQAWKGDLLL